MATEIGISQKIKLVMELIDSGVSPIIKHRNTFYVIETAGRDLGAIYYTRFDEIGIADYSVQMPFSFADTLGEILHKGDNLRAHIEPRVTELPALILAQIYHSINTGL